MSYATESHRFIDAVRAVLGLRPLEGEPARELDEVRFFRVHRERPFAMATPRRRTL